MPKDLLHRPLLVTAAIAFPVAGISWAVCFFVLGASGVPFIPVLNFLAIGLPAAIAPMIVYPLLVINGRQRTLRLELERLVRTDVLTELPNRRAFFESARPFLDARVAMDAPLTAMMIDVDHFKRINDSYGHDAGDLVLKRIAGVIRDEVAASGSGNWIVARLGGEEFAVIADGLVPTAVARLAERICGQVHRWVGAGESLEPVTVSVGVAFRAAGTGIDKLLKAADDAVYAAKRGGRDRWAFAGDRENEVVRSIGETALPEPANDRLAVG